VRFKLEPRTKRERVKNTKRQKGAQKKWQDNIGRNGAEGARHMKGMTRIGERGRACGLSAGRKNASQQLLAHSKRGDTSQGRLPVQKKESSCRGIRRENRPRSQDEENTVKYNSGLEGSRICEGGGNASESKEPEDRGNEVPERGLVKVRSQRKLYFRVLKEG